MPQGKSLHINFVIEILYKSVNSKNNFVPIVNIHVEKYILYCTTKRSRVVYVLNSNLFAPFLINPVYFLKVHRGEIQRIHKLFY